MSTLKLRGFAVALTLALLSRPVFAEAPQLGKQISPADLAAWDINVLPDGRGLPLGAGTPAEGARIYAAKCASCHGAEGKGGVNAKLVGGEPVRNMDSEKTIANFWPFATTLFDFIRRSMPWRQPMSLTSDETYALTAYILSLNKLIGPNDAMNAQTLPKVRMPNRDGFIVRFPDKTP